MPFFLYHGKEDDVIDCEQAVKTYQRFIEHGFKKVKILKEEFLGHSVSDQECQHFTEFLGTLMI